MVPIDKNVPMPARIAARGKKPKYPFADMKVGDSILHPGPVATASSAAYAFNLRSGSGFCWSYRVEDNGTRIWRRA